MMRMRQVEQRARPPQTLAWGTLLRRLASSTLRPSGNAHGAAVAIGEVDHAAAALIDGAGALGQQRDADQSEIADQGVVGDAIEHRLLLARPDLALRQVFRPPFAAVVVDDLSSALIKAQHGERRNQYGRRQQERRGAFEERLHPEPEIEADAAVHPGDGHDREHQPDPVRRRDPVQKKHLRIELLMSVQRLAEPHADDVGDHQHRHAQAQHELQRLDRLPAELAAFVERPDAERAMHQARGVEQDRDGEELPERGVEIDAARQRLHRDVAERVVEKMADQVGEQHDAADKADLPQADAANEGRDLFSGKSGHAIHTVNIGDHDDLFQR